LDHSGLTARDPRKSEKEKASSMNRLLPRTLIAAATVLASSLQANAAGTAPDIAYTAPTAAAPIRIDRVDFPPFTSGEHNLLARYITISFTNQQARPATDIVFGMLDSKGRVVDQYEDTGKFSPGVRIAAQVPFDQILDKVSGFEVEDATFADGSTWTKVDNPSRRQSAF
jgi:hypothetical protein